MLSDNKYVYAFLICRGVPNSPDSKLLGAELCTWGKGLFLFLALTSSALLGCKTSGKRQDVIFLQSKHSNKGKDSADLKGNFPPYLFGYVSLPKVISSVLKGKVFTFSFEKLLRCLVDLTAQSCSFLLSADFPNLYTYPCCGDVFGFPHLLDQRVTARAEFILS